MAVLDKNLLTLRVRDFTRYPGPRHRHEGDHSGEEFRDAYLEEPFKQARAEGKQLEVDLDQTEGYASSFLEEAFGGLARIYGSPEVQEVIRIKSDTRPWYVEEVEEYIREANDA